MRDNRRIRAWMILEGLTQVQVAKDMGLTVAAIHRWIMGGFQSQRIFSYFVGLGCPQEYLTGQKERRRNVR